MPRNWTAEQLSAIETRDKTLLVSAAAGSGKTTVLTERIIRLLTDPVSPASLERMLIVTFSRAAAAELRQRISAALSEALAREPQNRHLHRQLLALSSAKISTIHSFCLELIRANFQRLGMPAQVRVADEGEVSVLSRGVMDALIGELHDSDEGFGAFADHFTGARSDERLGETMLALYDALGNYPEGIGYLAERAAELRGGAVSLAGGWGAVVAERTRRLYAEGAAVYAAACADLADDELLAAKYLPRFAEEQAGIAAILAALDGGDYFALREAVRSLQFGRLGAIRGEKPPEAEYWAGARKRFKAAHDGHRDTFFPLGEEDLAAVTAETADVIDRLHALLAAYDERFSAEKKRRGICTFADIERYTLALLTDGQGEDSDLAQSLAAGFDLICIDEYQDVNAVQDRIFRALATPHARFMVGDIKQSIYRFRGAEPGIFADYRRVFPALGEAGEADAASIFMSNNFRCDRTVIDLSNRIFAYLFGHCGASIGYLPEDDLVCGKAMPEGVEPVPVVVALCVKPEAGEEDDEDDGDISAEHRYIAAECARLIREERLDSGEAIRPSDIAILLRSKVEREPLLSALAEAGVPAEAGDARTFFENPEVLMMICLLNTIDNPGRDVYLAGILRSPLFGFTLDELITVRRASTDERESLYAALVRYTDAHDWQKGRTFLDRLDEYRAMAEGTPVDQLLDALYRDTAVLAYAGAADDEESRRTPEQKRANLRRLYEYARRFEASSFRGLYNFIRYLNDLIEDETKIESPAPPVGDAVRILTMHQSKGLEFPVTFVMGLHRRFNLQDTGGDLLFDHGVGVAMRLRDESGFARRTTPMRDAVAAHLGDAQREEEMRILYVALTRARERLYLTAAVKDADAVLEAAEVRRALGGQDTLMRCSTYLDWVLAALSGTAQDCWHLEVRTEADALPAPLHIEETPAAAPSPVADDALIETLRHRFDFVYPDAHLTDLPAKLAVSKLYPTLLDDEPLPGEVGGRVSLPELRQRPAFLDGFAEDESRLAAERGTATHVFLQFCDFGRCTSAPTVEGIRREATRLVEARFITPRMAELLRAGELARFFASPFYADLASGRWSLRERRFHLYLPAARFTADPALAERLGDEQILVQGVIDLCYENAAGELILCDYKTDRLPTDRAEAAAILRERHGAQLGYYAEACRALFGRAPDRICLWSLALGEPFDIPV